MNFSTTGRRALLKAGGFALAFLGVAPGPSLPAARNEESNPPEAFLDASSVETDFKNSRWTFDGNVRINADPRGNLRSDEAVVEFEDSQLKRATATGNPAEFDQDRKSVV